MPTFKVAKVKMGCDGRIPSKNLINLKDKVLLEKYVSRMPLVGLEAFGSTKCITICVAHAVTDSAVVSLWCLCFLPLSAERERERVSILASSWKQGPPALLKILSPFQPMQGLLCYWIPTPVRQTLRPGPPGSAEACQLWSTNMARGGEALCGWESLRERGG